jgi:hypothetical protein
VGGVHSAIRMIRDSKAWASRQQEKWASFFLPNEAPRHWTWQMIFLACVAVLVFVDTFFIYDSPQLDPGVTGEGMLFMVLALRAVNRRGLSTPIMLVGTGLAIFTSCLNHRLLVFRPNSFSVLTALALALILIFCGYTRKTIESPKPAGPDADSILRPPAKD